MAWPIWESREEKKINNNNSGIFIYTNAYIQPHTHSNCTHTNAFAPQCLKPRQTEIWIKRWLNTKKNIVLHYKFSLIHEPVNYALSHSLPISFASWLVCVSADAIARTHLLTHKYLSVHSSIWFDESISEGIYHIILVHYKCMR